MPPPWVQSQAPRGQTAVIEPGNAFKPSAPTPAQQRPQSLGALLQQAPLREPLPSINDGFDANPQPKPPPQLTKPKQPVPAGPLAGAKLVLPPIPVRPALKAVGGKSPAQIAKIAKLRSSVRSRPQDIRGLLNEIEGGKSLNHVTCDDRSKPLVGRCQTFFPNF